jgi:8-oxo-dGTP diphosphatase
MKVYLVRHGRAGNRTTWEGDDRMRPLTRAGQRQAEQIARLLRDEPFERIVSSPYVRCIQTVVPLAAERSTSVEVDDALMEGASLGAAWSLVQKHAASGAVLCTHGDVVPMILGHLESRGIPIGRDPQWPKGSTWVLECNDECDVVSVRYEPPPAG